MKTYILFLLSLCVAIRLADSLQDQSRLYNYMLTEYYKQIRPTHKVDSATNVTISLQLKNINDYDSEKRILSIYGWLTTQWTDYRLKWDPSDYGGITQLQVPYSVIWTPDVMMVNSIDPGIPALPSSNTNALVTSNGDVTFIIPSMFRSPCDYSGGSNSCIFQFSSRSYNGKKIDLRISNNVKGVDLNDQVSKYTQVEVLSTNASRIFKYFACCTEPYPSIKFTIDINAHSSSGVNKVYLSKITLLMCIMLFMWYLFCK